MVALILFVNMRRTLVGSLSHMKLTQQSVSLFYMFYIFKVNYRNNITY